MRFFKVTTFDECHEGFQYRDGLNIDTVPFAESGSCVARGLYFTNAANIEHFYSYGDWVREVSLPTEHPQFQMVKDSDDLFCKWRASILCLGRKVSLSDPAACQSLGLPVMSMDQASTVNKCAVLTWWKHSKQSGLELKYSARAIDLASYVGNVAVLNWWRYSGLHLKYTVSAINLASFYGKLAVLEWWKHSGLELKYSEAAFDNASQRGDLAVLNWWKSSGLELKYSEDALQHASYVGNLAVAEWWKHSGLQLKYSEEAIREALSANDVAVLDWWKKLLLSD